jgi:putative tricarboxylic transport membrane protein
LTTFADSYKEKAAMNKDQAGGLFFLFVGIWVFSLSLKLPFGKFTEPGPAIFPFILSILLSITGILIFLSARGKSKIDLRKSFTILAKPLAIILLTLGFIIFMGRLGYLITSFLYLFSLFLFVCRFKLFFALGLSGILATGSWYFFGKILGIFLPIGPWNI